MSVQRVLTPNYEEGVDRKTLTVLRERFLKISHGRLQRTRDALGARQQVVLDLLPLLFHVNHPLFPGYVSHQTPARFADYTPTKEEIGTAQRYSRTFRYRDQSRANCDLHSLFLMGSSGTVAQSEGSDMDLWLCHRPDLDQEQLQALRRKCDLISQWAGEQGQELHVFLIDEQAFRSGRVQARTDAEDCGSAQHFLLLDEFYRSSILLAGNGPLWWLIPAYVEADYAHYAHLLQHKRFIRPGQYADLGGVARIPPEEFIGAGLWQLYKGIDSPYKSVLKLLLAEVYAQEPERLNLCLSFKQAVYEDRLDLDELDPYVMAYRRLEQYLQRRGEQERLELVRRCVYLKTGERLSVAPGQGGKRWRRQLMERLVTEWGWGRTELKRLDGRQRWKVQQAQNERRVLVNELTYSYRFLSQYARTHMAPAAIKADDVNLLGRKLYAAFQRKAGKIEFINPGIAPQLAEEQLAFHHKSSQQIGDGNGWLLYRNLPSPTDAAFHPALKRSNSLIELIAWTYFNGLLDSSTSLSLVAGTSHTTLYELQAIVADFRQMLPLPLPAVPQADFRQNSYPRHCALFVNVGLDPMAELTRQGIYKVSSRTDALGYSSQRSNLIQTLDLVTLNSWQELTVNRFEHGDALIQCLQSLLAMIIAAPRKPLPRISVHCHCPTRAVAIATRVEELLQDVTQALMHSPAQGPSPGRYVLEIDSRFFVLQFIEGEPRFASFDSRAELLHHLGRAQRHYSPILLDRHALADSPLAVVCGQAQPGKVQVFYQRKATAASTDDPAPVASVDLYVLDEQGSLITQTMPFYDQQTLLTPLHRFLQAVQERHQMHQNLDDNVGLAPEILFFELVETPQSTRPTLVSRRLPNEAVSGRYLEVQAIGNQNHQGQMQFDIFCDHQEFSALEYGEQLIPAVAHYIVSRRVGRELYPCYITDLGLPQDLEHQPYRAHRQTMHYLQYKWELEDRLNAAQRSFRAPPALAPAP